MLNVLALMIASTYAGNFASDTKAAHLAIGYLTAPWSVQSRDVSKTMPTFRVPLTNVAAKVLINVLKTKCALRVTCIDCITRQL